MIEARFLFNNPRQFRAGIEKGVTGMRKATDTALKVEGFRLKKLLEKELKAGAPGGRAFDPLTEMARRTMGKYDKSVRPARKALTRSRGAESMHRAIRYNAYSLYRKFVFAFGFIDPAKGEKLSKSWKRLARLHQEGFVRTVTEAQRRYYARRGSKLVGKTGRRLKAAKFFFLKKGTTTFRTPARPIIDPFWAAHRGEAERNVKSNFEKKLRGERI